LGIKYERKKKREIENNLAKRITKGREVGKRK